MSIAERTTAPPLEAGQHLRQPEFHARYAAMPPGTKAELIAGVVVMPSPVGMGHGIRSGRVLTWLTYYHFRTPHTEVMDNTTVILHDRGEVQPDALMRIVPAKGGQTRDVGKYVGGCPELVVEVAGSSRAIDLGAKLAEYEKAGALEYVVLAIDPDEVLWHARRGDRLVRVDPGADGVYRSTAFPGLWLDPLALLADDGPALLATLDRGLASGEHAAFVADLDAR